ncbi:MAG TPA: site-2 protease family protein [Acidimicrobiales bacterium]|nr:site-2 protease family protein [Acidimicrobiales bacterium]
MAIGVAVLVLLVRVHRITSFELLMLGALIPSVILHEVSHGAVALACGDDTAKRAGRLTLNPVPHIDPFGTIILPAIMALSGVGILGYAKPVPVNIAGLRHPRNQAVLVSLVGPAVNILLALLCAAAVKHFVPAPVRQEAGLGSPAGVYLSDLPGWAQYVFVAGFVNVILAAFNLIPLPPLDGSAVLERLLPRQALPHYYRLRPFTIFIPLAVVVLFPGALGHVFSPALSWFGHLVA